MRAVIDTNVIIYDAVEDSEFHIEAVDLLESLNSWYIPMIVLYEFNWFLRRQNIKAKIALELTQQYIDDPKSRIININPKDIIDALKLIDREKLSLSRINDKTILLIAKRLGISLATFDIKLKKQATKLGIMTIPKNL